MTLRGNGGRSGTCIRISSVPRTRITVNALRPWSRRRGLDSHLPTYKVGALPLCYVGNGEAGRTRTSTHGVNSPGFCYSKSRPIGAGSRDRTCATPRGYGPSKPAHYHSAIPAWRRQQGSDLHDPEGRWFSRPVPHQFGVVALVDSPRIARGPLDCRSRMLLLQPRAL